MGYRIWGTKIKNGTLRPLNGHWKTLKIAKEKKFAAQLEGYLDLEIRKISPKTLQGRSGRHNTRK